MNLILIDYHDQARQALSSFLSHYGHFIIQSFKTATDFIEAAPSLSLLPDVAIIDYRQPSLDGYAGARWIQENMPTVKIIMNATFKEGVPLDQLRALGIHGLIVKMRVDEEHMLTALQLISQGNNYFPD